MWFFWFVGAILIAASWLRVVDVSTGWIGFGLTVLASWVARTGTGARELQEYSRPELRQLVETVSDEIEADESNAAAWLSRGQVHFQLQEWELSIFDFSKVIELTPEPSQAEMARTWSASAFQELERHDEAIAIVSPVIDSPAGGNDENLRFALEVRAGSLIGVEEFEESLEDCEQRIRIGNRTADVCLLQGQALLGLKRYSEAMSVFEQVGRISPMLASGWHLQSDIKSTCPDAAMRNGSQAVSLSERACRLAGPDGWICIAGLANAWAECGDFDKAVHFAEKAFEAAPENEKEQRRERIEQFRQGQPFRHP
jgi:tetratricopeptide (TPR) repeat protein